MSENNTVLWVGTRVGSSNLRKTLKHWSVIVSLIAGALALTPYVFLYLGHQVPYFVIVPANFVAWISVSLLFVSHRRMLDSVDNAFQEIGLEVSEGSLEDKLSGFLWESARYYRASYSLGPGTNSRGSDLGANLRQIVKLAYQELNAQAVELALYDEASRQWSQAFIMGIPSEVTSQNMLGEALTQLTTAETSPSTILQPVQFAGTNFGIFRIEFRDNQLPSTSDRKVVQLLAMQGALMLIDARFTEELLRMRRKSEESTRAKTGFLANLSHEIRGPLSVILNASELMLDNLCGPLAPQAQETCGMIKKSGEHLLDLVNDVLDYAKVEAGKVTAVPVPVGIKDLLNDLANVVRSQAMMKKQLLTVEEVDATLGMLCDKRHARQMIINFLTNAVKYTPDGGAITVSAQRVVGSKVRVYVKDTGVGIPEREREKVFTAFERVNNPYALAQSGTGLGMPLTRRLAEVNGGTADFESIEGQGSSFWIQLPLAEVLVPTVRRDEDDVKSNQPQGRGELVLLVDSAGESRQMLERYLVHQGFQVVGASTGSEVMRALKERVVEIAVVENDLPELGGEGMIALIRGNPKAYKVPIILLSSKAFVFDIERFLRLGVDRCLSKPVPLAEIALTARKLVDETKMLERQLGVTV